ncbi:hypothetical protein CRYUN_Cryun38cG0005200 [Craigia yunnanensis]
MVNLTKDLSAIPYMGVEFLNGGPQIFNCFYSFSLQIAIKGVEIELVKVSTMLTSIDLSNNKFQGEIPKVIGELISLKGLNLSHNNFSGCIPTSIGNLISLEWLDLSSNKLVGTIPERLLDLSFLSIFNVSENQLKGPILKANNLTHLETIHSKETTDYVHFQCLKVAATVSHHLRTCWKKMAQIRTLLLAGK